jgi:hypothetical protein
LEETEDRRGGGTDDDDNDDDDAPPATTHVSSLSEVTATPVAKSSKLRS